MKRKKHSTASSRDITDKSFAQLDYNHIIISLIGWWYVTYNSPAAKVSDKLLMPPVHAGPTPPNHTFFSGACVFTIYTKEKSIRLPGRGFYRTMCRNVATYGNNCTTHLLWIGQLCEFAVNSLLTPPKKLYRVKIQRLYRPLRQKKTYWHIPATMWWWCIVTWCSIMLDLSVLIN